MSIFDKAKNAVSGNKDTISDQVDQHGDRIDQGIDRGSDVANERTGGKYQDQITQGGDHVRDRLDGLDGQNDDLRDAGRQAGEQTDDPA